VAVARQHARIAHWSAPGRPPDQGADQATAILDAQQGLDQLEQHPERLAQGGASTAFEKAEKLAGRFGLDKCASG
jgi:hypothetical protein